MAGSGGHSLRSGFQFAGSSRVRSIDSDLIAGAATSTSGNIVIHEISQDSSQFWMKPPVSMNGKLAIAAAIAHVNPDWMTPKTK
jgi:hypothetical protein